MTQSIYHPWISRSITPPSSFFHEIEGGGNTVKKREKIGACGGLSTGYYLIIIVMNQSTILN